MQGKHAPMAAHASVSHTTYLFVQVLRLSATLDSHNWFCRAKVFYVYSCSYMSNA